MKKVQNEQIRIQGGIIGGFSQCGFIFSESAKGWFISVNFSRKKYINIYSIYIHVFIRVHI